jgi:ATP-dependent Zn protease
MVAIYVPLIPLFLFARRQLMGKPAKKKSRANESSVTFRDVAGVDQAKQELMEVRQQLWLDDPVTAGTKEVVS